MAIPPNGGTTDSWRPSDFGCPPRSELRRFAAGELTGPSLAEMAVHLELCPDCRDEVETTRDFQHLSDAIAPSGQVAPLPGYRLVRRLGVGGTGEVWLAEDEDLVRPRALKYLRPELLSEVEVEALRSEAALIDDLGSHPHRVRVSRFLTSGSRPVVVMHFVAGGRSDTRPRCPGPRSAGTARRSPTCSRPSTTATCATAT